MKLTSGKLAILSLSLMLVSTYSISAILPFMLDYYKGCSSRQVDILISIPSFAIMLTILASTWLARYLNERLMITGGLLLLSLSGIAPLFIQDYPFVLLTRILLGLGIGLLVIVRADSIPVLTAGAVISGLAHTAAITCVFNGLPVHLPIELIHTATSIVLLGCNLGASLTPFVIGFAEHLHPGASTAFYACAILLSAAAIINTILNKVKPDAAISVL